MANETIGATGRFPAGRLNEDDEGELAVALTSEDGRMVLHFGKPIAWLAMTPDEAREFAAALIERADRMSK